MEQRTFAVGKHPRVVIAQLDGSLRASPWERAEIMVEAAGALPSISQEGDSLLIGNCTGDLTVYIPVSGRFIGSGLKGLASISATGVSGQVILEKARHVALKDIGGSVVLKQVAGDVLLEQAPSLEADNLGGDLKLVRVAQAVLGNVGGDISAQALGNTLRVGNVGGDVKVSESAEAEIALGNVGGDLTLQGARLVQLARTGGDLRARDIRQELRVSQVGGDFSCLESNGVLQVGQIGGDASLHGTYSGLEMGSVGGDLRLESNFPAGSQTSLRVGGDAKIKLPEDANLRLQAIVGGDVRVAGASYSQAGKFINLSYGEGAGFLDLKVGGDLSIQGGPGSPQFSNAYGESWNNFGREMAEFGREMGRMGRELGRGVLQTTLEGNWERKSSGYAQERAAILRMVAEGRISPEEGNLLLQGLKH